VIAAKVGALAGVGAHHAVVPDLHRRGRAGAERLLRGPARLFVPLVEAGPERRRRILVDVRAPAQEPTSVLDQGEELGGGGDGGIASIATLQSIG
jgi:hypothetical protein